MATLRNQQKSSTEATVARDSQEEHSRNSPSRDKAVPGINEDFFYQVSEKLEVKVTTTVSQDFGRTESRFLHSELDDFLLIPQVWVQSGTTPRISRNPIAENQEPNEDISQEFSIPEVGTSIKQSTQFLSSVPDEAS